MAVGAPSASLWKSMEMLMRLAALSQHSCSTMTTTQTLTFLFYCKVQWILSVLHETRGSECAAVHRSVPLNLTGCLAMVSCSEKQWAVHEGWDLMKWLTEVVSVQQWKVDQYTEFFQSPPPCAALPGGPSSPLWSPPYHWGHGPDHIALRTQQSRSTSSGSLCRIPAVDPCSRFPQYIPPLGPKLTQSTLQLSSK